MMYQYWFMSWDDYAITMLINSGGNSTSYRAFELVLIGPVRVLLGNEDQGGGGSFQAERLTQLMA